MYLLIFLEFANHGQTDLQSQCGRVQMLQVIWISSSKLVRPWLYMTCRKPWHLYAIHFPNMYASKLAIACSRIAILWGMSWFHRRISSSHRRHSSCRFSHLSFRVLTSFAPKPKFIAKRTAEVVKHLSKLVKHPVLVLPIRFLHQVAAGKHKRALQRYRHVIKLALDLIDKHYGWESDMPDAWLRVLDLKLCLSLLPKRAQWNMCWDMLANRRGLPECNSELQIALDQALEQFRAEKKPNRNVRI